MEKNCVTIRVHSQQSDEKKNKERAMFYFGEYRVTLDDKGRMRIPNKIRTQLGSESVTICAGTDGALFLMTESEFSGRIAELAEDTPFADFGKQNALRMFSSTVFTPDEDAQGRFILPSKLKEYAKINKKVVFLGAMNRVEIWSEEAYDKVYGADKLDINGAVRALGI